MAEPIIPGWYRTVGAADWMIYALDHYNGTWSAHALNGDSVQCGWDYIDQAGQVELIARYS